MLQWSSEKIGLEHLAPNGGTRPGARLASYLHRALASMRGMGWCGVLDDGAVDRVPGPRYLKKAEGNPAGRRCEAASRCSQPATCRGRHVTEARLANESVSEYLLRGSLAPSFPPPRGLALEPPHLGASQPYTIGRYRRGGKYQPMSRNSKLSLFFLPLS